MAPVIERKWGSGRPLKEQARQIIFNVAMYLKTQKEKYNLKYNILESTSAATGVSVYAVKSVLREHKELLSSFNDPPVSDQNCEVKKEGPGISAKEEINIKEEPNTDNEAQLFDTAFVAVKEEPEFSGDEMNIEGIKSEPDPQSDEDREWKQEYAEALSDSSEYKEGSTENPVKNGKPPF